MPKSNANYQARVYCDGKLQLVSPEIDREFTFLLPEGVREIALKIGPWPVPCESLFAGKLQCSLLEGHQGLHRMEWRDHD